jgi:photosystem II stability/assembly factor-like uncharacterized protein
MKDSLNGVGATTQADIVRTSNGGQTWIGTNNFGNQHVAVSFYGTQNGVWVGYYGCIQRSTDGGATLQSITGEYNYYHYNKIKFTDAQNGYCIGEGGKILKTNNGGQQWTFLNGSTSTELNDLSFVNTNLGYIVGNAGTIRKTSNGGTTWTNLAGIPSNTDLYSVYFINQNTGWVAGEASAMYKTTNGGTTWTQQTLPNYTFYVNQVSFVDVNVGYATGASNGNLFKTTDGGATWISLTQNMLQLGNIVNFQFFSADTGIASTTQWNFIKTTDGGTTWIPLANFCVGVPVLHFMNQNVGVISGDNTNYDCKMYITQDGGLTWQNTHVPFGPDANGVFMTDTNSVYICGNDGSIANFGGISNVITNIVASNKFNDQSINIFPNPVSNMLHVSSKFENMPMELVIMDIRGKVILNQTYTQNDITLNVEDLNSGLYFIQVKNAAQLSLTKFIKQ